MTLQLYAVLNHACSCTLISDTVHCMLYNHMHGGEI